MADEIIRYPYIVFGDGTTAPGHFGQDGSILWVWLSDPTDGNTDFIRLAERFSNPEVTGEMTCHENERYFYSCSGFTWLTDISVDPDTNIPKIRLRTER